MVFRWGHFGLRFFAVRAKILEFDVATVKVRRRRSESAKMRRRSAKFRRWKCEGTNAKEWYCYRSFAWQLRTLAFATSHFRIRILWSHSQVSIDYIEFDASILLAQSLPINLRYYWYACTSPSCLLFKCLLHSAFTALCDRYACAMPPCLLWIFINILQCNVTLNVY